MVENFTSGDAFSVWGGYDNDATGVFNNETVSYNGTAWTYTGGDRYWVFDKTYDFYAVYPKEVGSCDKDGTITVKDFDCSKGDDLMTADNTGITYKTSAETAPVSFTFRHELARVNIVVQVDPGVTVTNLNATLSGFGGSGTLTRKKDGTITWTETTEGSVDGTLSAIQPSSEENLFTDLLLIPQSTNSINLDISFQRNDESVPQQTISLAGNPVEWLAGQPYRYVLHIKVDAITFSGFTVDKWDTTESDGNINIQ